MRLVLAGRFRRSGHASFGCGTIDANATVVTKCGAVMMWPCRTTPGNPTEALSPFGSGWVSVVNVFTKRSGVSG